MTKSLKAVLGAATVAASVMLAGAVSAATLTFTGTGQTQLVKKNDLGLGLNDTSLAFISGDKKTTSNGLEILGTGPFSVKFTYLGFEAGNTNYSAHIGGTFFVNKGLGATSNGTSVTFNQLAAGLIDFSFGTSSPPESAGVIANNGIANPNSGDYAIGYKILSATSALVLFDDIASGDRDFDDLAIQIDIAAVPVPAAGFLLLGALGGLAALRRRKAA